ncbi:MAG: GTP-binding protein [Promethearchaeota archaeon]|nr:MAG: GTP-binding protein [Candidatus Lokiarchaeota archaeon]
MSKIPTNPEEYLKTYTLKLCTLGDGGVGKTTFVERVATGIFNHSTKITIGIDIQSIHVVLDTDGEKILIRISVWDLGGENQFRFILPTYITGADGGLLLFDVSQVRSMRNLHEWADLWREHTTPGIPLYLVGAKYDCLVPRFEPTIRSTMQTLKKQLSADKCFLTSSKTGEQIYEVIISIIIDMLQFKKINLKLQEENFHFSQK